MPRIESALRFVDKTTILETRAWGQNALEQMVVNTGTYPRILSMVAELMRSRFTLATDLALLAFASSGALRPAAAASPDHRERETGLDAGYLKADRPRRPPRFQP